MKNKTENQHLGIPIKSLSSCRNLKDIEFSVNPGTSEINLNNLGYGLISLDNVGWVLESQNISEDHLFGILVHLGKTNMGSFEILNNFLVLFMNLGFRSDVNFRSFVFSGNLSNRN